MSVPATEAVTPGILGTAGTSSTGAPNAAETDKNMFMQLLVAQMRYQDPMNPTDSSQFLAQSAQFTSLEKMQDVADHTASLFSAQVSFGASGLIGKQVTWTDAASGAAKSGTVNGVTFGANGPILDVGGNQLPIASVLSVTDGSASTPTGTTTPAS
ncbi:MAG: flagellar hook capping protein [Marmoricola sp.]|nr:flagellar hook capping protein [Marmoricola sp.]